MDWVSAICFLILGVFGGIVLMGVLLTFQERRQERREINLRLEQVKRESKLPWDLNQPLITQIPVHLGFWIATLLAKRYHKTEAVVWRCWVCGKFFESEERPRPLCLCNGCLAEYQKVVA